MKTSDQIKGLARATGMTNPMTRPDYRQGIRAGMLRDAKEQMRALVDGPHMLVSTPIRGLNPKARATLARKLAEVARPLEMN